MKTSVFGIPILCILLAAPALSAEVAVIAHPSVPIKQITSAELLDLYSGDVKEWNNGSPVIILDLKPDTIVRDTFYRYLGKSSSRMKSIWMKHMLSGEGRPPEAHKSGEDILKKVMATPGAVGYVNRDLVTNGVVELVIIPIEE